MLTIDIRHPDVDQFIEVKKDRTKVTGANISIKVRDDFMQAVKTNSEYCLRFPCDIEPVKKMSMSLNTMYQIDGNYYKWINARDLWDKIIQGAWDSAEPGLLFIDRAIDYSPDGVYDAYRPTNTNPCGEQYLQPYDSCRLILINLYSFVIDPFTPNARIDWNKLYEVCYEQLRLGDNLVDLEIEHIDRIISKIQSDPEPESIKQTELELWQKCREQALAGRRVGAGITALADMLAALGLKYDSEPALAMIEEVMKTKMRAELDATIDLAILRGSFKGFNADQEFNIAGDDMNGYVITNGNNTFYETLLNNFSEQCYKMCQYGRRNVNWSTIAPAGSVNTCAII